MQKKPLISVIVPIYNVAAYLPRCLDSITQQTYQNLEIILVDDGSTDDSLEICQQYAKKDNRIKVIHHENKGLPGARNTGIDAMHGDFVAFLDADDWLPLTAYETLLTLHQKTGADITWGILFYNTSAQNFQIPSHFRFPKENLEHLNVEDILCTRNIHCVDKMYKTSLFSHGFRFNTSFTFSEDVEFLFYIIQKANFIAFTNHPVYYYFMRSTSTTHSLSISKLSDDIRIWYKIYAFVYEQNLTKAIVPVTCTVVGNLCVFLMAIILYDQQNAYELPLQQTQTWLRAHVKDILCNSPMKWAGRIFIFFPLYYPHLAKKLFRLPWIHPILCQQFKIRTLPKIETI
ncbi:MAG: glycosyltransferase family 2 protein [Elusimicrobiaceae bacterium]|nr:glycosyltransferase family 2 protein [Elusimicrobiaceae bacterium]